MSSAQKSVWKKAVLLPPLLFALWLLKDEDNGKLAVWKALRDHPPSMRVYRALGEITLLLCCTAFALYVWSRTEAIGTRSVGRLLFLSPEQQHKESRRETNYRPVSASEEDGDSRDSIDEAEDENVRHSDDHDVIIEEEEESFSENDVFPEPPSAASVAGAALDLMLCCLLSLFFFTLSCADVNGIPTNTFERISNIAAPVFPLGLFIGTSVACFFPWSKRKDFWTVVSWTVSAPFCDVKFRDGFIGDVFTSTVRPLQDLAFTLFYVLAGLRGWWSQSYDLNHADTPVERSWLLHTVVLPACMVSPLWWRFLQNLRQSYDEKQRWPYLGNALKYMVAAEVAMFGVFDPTKKEHYLWIFSFVVATLYQVWWDVFMDWELLRVSPTGSITLRSKRLYPSKSMYWIIFVVNFLLRFCWTLSFLPQIYLHPSGIIKETFEGNWAEFIGPAIACAEIVRRSLWGLLRLELETIKVEGEEKSGTMTEELPASEIELKPMSFQEDKADSMSLHDSMLAPTLPLDLQKDLSNASDLQILGELSLWATAFFSLGILAAAHRETM